MGTFCVAKDECKPKQVLQITLTLIAGTLIVSPLVPQVAKRNYKGGELATKKVPCRYLLCGRIEWTRTTDPHLIRVVL